MPARGVLRSEDSERLRCVLPAVTAALWSVPSRSVARCAKSSSGFRAAGRTNPQYLLSSQAIAAKVCARPCGGQVRQKVLMKLRESVEHAADAEQLLGVWVTCRAVK